MSREKETPKKTEGCWFEKIFDETRAIMHITWELDSLADAFMGTGNSLVSEAIREIARELNTSQDIISKAVGEHSTEDYKQSEQATRNVLLTALGMCDVIPKEEAAKRIKVA